MRRSKKKLRNQLRNKPITVTQKERDKMQRKATEDAVQIVQLFQLWTLRTKYGFGTKRLKEYMAHNVDLLDSFNRGYVTLPDIAQQLLKETGIRVGEVEVDEGK